MKPRVVIMLLVALAALLLATQASAVHESHHGAVFAGSSSQGERTVLRVFTHHTVGVRFGWRARCESGPASGTARFHRLKVGRGGTFFGTAHGGVSVRGKIGFDPLGNPVYPAPFSFANNEAGGRLRAVFSSASRGRCNSGTVTWAASR
jgi:hypothetical protein